MVHVLASLAFLAIAAATSVLVALMIEDRWAAIATVLGLSIETRRPVPVRRAIRVRTATRAPAAVALRRAA